MRVVSAQTGFCFIPPGAICRTREGAGFCTWIDPHNLGETYMTTILNLQVRNLRLKYFPEVTGLEPAELVCSNSEPPASVPSEPPCCPPPSSLCPAGDSGGPFGQGTAARARSPSPISLVWKKLMWTRFVCCVLPYPLSGLLPSLEPPGLLVLGQVGSTGHLTLSKPLV